MSFGIFAVLNFYSIAKAKFFVCDYDFDTFVEIYCKIQLKSKDLNLVKYVPSFYGAFGLFKKKCKIRFLKIFRKFFEG